MHVICINLSKKEAEMINWLIDRERIKNQRNKRISINQLLESRIKFFIKEEIEPYYIEVNDIE